MFIQRLFPILMLAMTIAWCGCARKDAPAKEQPTADSAPSVDPKAERILINATRSAITTLNGAINQYMLEHIGKLPNSLMEVVPYLQNSKGVPKDGWGNDFAYVPNHERSSWTLSSAGTDGILGTLDDITN